MGRQKLSCGAEDFEHLGFGLADAKAAQGVAWKIHGHEGMSTFSTQQQAGAALDDREERLVSSPLGLATALGPKNCSANRIGYHLKRTVARRTFIEAHGDICAQVLLDLDGALGAEFQPRAIDMRLENAGAVINL